MQLPGIFDNEFHTYQLDLYCIENDRVEGSVFYFFFFFSFRVCPFVCAKMVRNTGSNHGVGGEGGNSNDGSRY